MNPKERLYEEESRDLSRARGKLSCLFGISLVPIFVGLDYILVPSLATKFAAFRALNTLENVAIYFILSKGTKLSLRSLNLISSFYFCSIAAMISTMCHLMGGFSSPYYAGLNIVMLVIGIVMVWHAFYTFLCGVVIYLTYLFINLPGTGQWKDLVNSNYFLLSTILICIMGTYWKEKQRYREFELRQELKEVDEKKSNFLATISHELKTPMTLIVNPVEQALLRSSSDDVVLSRAQSEVIRRNTYRLATLVSDLIEIARGEIGKKRLVPAEVPEVGRYFEDMFQGMRPLFEQKGIDSRFVVKGSLKPHFFDHKKIDKVFYNLLANALKFTPRNGHVTVSLEDVTVAGSDQPLLEVTVEDDGVGIPEDKLKDIFERFVQVEEGMSRSYEGMGVGLSLVKDFVEQHGGDIFVKSSLGRGALFRVRLPRGKQHFHVPVLDSSEQGPLSEAALDFTRRMLQDTQGFNQKVLDMSGRFSTTNPAQAVVLVVDDNEDLRNSISEGLSFDYRVITARSGGEALQILSEKKPDLIISDIMMPEMNGYELTEAIRKRENFKDLPIILLTAKSGEEAMASGFSSGANDYLTKPFSPNELRLRVQNLLMMRELKAEMVRQQNLASIGTLSAGISHNMNTYAASIDFGLGLLESLISEEADKFPKVKKTQIESGLKNVHTALSSIRSMIQSLEVYSQKNIEGYKETDIVETTRSVIDLAKTLFPSSIQLYFESPEKLPVVFNPHTLNPALMNLIDNAMDACKIRGEGEVKVLLSPEKDDRILIQVKDTGSGIPAEIQERIWEPYFTTKDVHEGTGLGLWMVKKAIEDEHGGQVWFESGPQGTTFFIRLPRHGRGYGRGKTEENLPH